MAKNILKNGGLLFSGILTMSLFATVFGTDGYGLLLAFVALVLFEVGAIGWTALLRGAREQQRITAIVCLCVTVGLSLLSSILQIIISTDLGADMFATIDLKFVTLLSIGVALSTNIIGAIVFEYTEPETAEQMHELARDAKVKSKQNSLKDSLINLSLSKSEKLVKEKADGVARELADSIRAEVIRSLKEANDIPQLPEPRAQLSLPRPVQSFAFQPPTEQPRLPITRPTAMDFEDDEPQAAKPTTPQSENEEAEVGGDKDFLGGKH